MSVYGSILRRKGEIKLSNALGALQFRGVQVQKKQRHIRLFNSKIVHTSMHYADEQDGMRVMNQEGESKFYPNFKNDVINQENIEQSELESRLLEHMQEKQFEIIRKLWLYVKSECPDLMNLNLYNICLNAYAQWGSNNAEAYELFLFMLEEGFSPTAESYEYLMTILAYDHRLEDILTLHGIMKNHNEIEPTNNVYWILYVMLQDGNLRRIREQFKNVFSFEPPHFPIRCNLNTSLFPIQLALRVGKCNVAVSIMDHILKNDAWFEKIDLLRRDIFKQLSLLNRHAYMDFFNCNAGRLGQKYASEMLHELLKMRGVKHAEFIFCSMIPHLSLRELEKAYVLMMEACASQHDMQVACRVYEKYEKSVLLGRSMAFTGIDFLNSLTVYFVRLDKQAQARSTLSRILALNLKPDAHTHAVICEYMVHFYGPLVSWNSLIFNGTNCKFPPVHTAPKKFPELSVFLKRLAAVYDSPTTSQNLFNFSSQHWGRWILPQDVSRDYIGLEETTWWPLLSSLPDFPPVESYELLVRCFAMESSIGDACRVLEFMLDYGYFRQLHLAPLADSLAIAQDKSHLMEMLSAVTQSSAHLDAELLGRCLNFHVHCAAEERLANTIYNVLTLKSASKFAAIEYITEFALRSSIDDISFVTDITVFTFEYPAKIRVYRAQAMAIACRGSTLDIDAFFEFVRSDVGIDVNLLIALYFGLLIGQRPDVSRHVLFMETRRFDAPLRHQLFQSDRWLTIRCEVLASINGRLGDSIALLNLRNMRALAMLEQQKTPNWIAWFQSHKNHDAHNEDKFTTLCASGPSTRNIDRLRYNIKSLMPAQQKQLWSAFVKRRKISGNPEFHSLSESELSDEIRANLFKCLRSCMHEIRKYQEPSSKLEVTQIRRNCFKNALKSLDLQNPSPTVQGYIGCLEKLVSDPEIDLDALDSLLDNKVFENLKPLVTRKPDIFITIDNTVKSFGAPYIIRKNTTHSSIRQSPPPRSLLEFAQALLNSSANDEKQYLNSIINSFSYEIKNNATSSYQESFKYDEKWCEILESARYAAQLDLNENDVLPTNREFLENSLKVVERIKNHNLSYSYAKMLLILGCEETREILESIALSCAGIGKLKTSRHFIDAYGRKFHCMPSVELLGRILRESGKFSDFQFSSSILLLCDVKHHNFINLVLPGILSTLPLSMGLLLYEKLSLPLTDDVLLSVFCNCIEHYDGTLNSVLKYAYSTTHQLLAASGKQVESGTIFAFLKPLLALEDSDDCKLLALNLICQLNVQLDTEIVFLMNKILGNDFCVSATRSALETAFGMSYEDCKKHRSSLCNLPIKQDATRTIFEEIKAQVSLKLKDVISAADSNNTPAMKAVDLQSAEDFERLAYNMIVNKNDAELMLPSISSDYTSYHETQEFTQLFSQNFDVSRDQQAKLMAFIERIEALFPDRSSTLSTWPENCELQEQRDSHDEQKPLQ